MTQLLATYSHAGQRRRIELVALRDGAVVLDRRGEDGTLVVAELSREEGETQARAVLDAGRYLERARAGEPRLCRRLGDDDPLSACRRPRGEKP